MMPWTKYVDCENLTEIFQIDELEQYCQLMEEGEFWIDFYLLSIGCPSFALISWYFLIIVIDSSMISTEFSLIGFALL